MVAISPLLDTKLSSPNLRPGLVPRPRLSERLNRGAESKLTLVSAPAGVGKTQNSWLTLGDVLKQTKFLGLSAVRYRCSGLGGVFVGSIAAGSASST